MDHLLTRLSQSITQASNEEALVRPLLEMLQQVTQLDSTYLTTIDFNHALQHVLYAHNTRHMQIPEGLAVPWNDTLCQRALNEGRMCTLDVQERWDDSLAAKALGIHTYISAPVRMSDGSIYGTLCAASSSPSTLPHGTEVVLQLFAKLIAQHVERDSLMQQLQARNRQLTEMALTDSLTQLPNRAALLEELHRLLTIAQRSSSSVLVAFVDLDGFKQINDLHGHAIGDLLLRTLAQRLQHSLRNSDMVARMGGDEFVMVSLQPDANVTPSALSAIEQRLRLASTCELALPDGHTLHYPGASVGLAVVSGACSMDNALQQADSAMYADKQRRRTQGISSTRSTAHA